MKFMVAAVLVWGTMAFWSQPRPNVSNHVDWVNQSLTQMQQIKEGMTRADLERVFTPDGGLQMYTETTYVYRECPYFKVDVQFEQEPNRPAAIGPKDKIIKISKPYIAQPALD